MPSARFKISIQESIAANVFAFSSYDDLVLLDDEKVHVPARHVRRSSWHCDYTKIKSLTAGLTVLKRSFVLPRRAVLDVEIASYLHAMSMTLIDKLPQPWRSTWSVSIGRVQPFEERAAPQEGILIASILNEDKELVVAHSSEHYFPLVLWCAVH